MILPPAQQSGTSLMLVEGGLTAIAIAVAFCWPRLGSAFFSRIERAFRQLAQSKKLAVVVVGATAFLLRLAILPLCPIPQPFIYDDFSFLLAADTFASGRLTNPTPAMWMHFESFHITMKPTYMSMYFPAQGMILAAGKLLTGHPWFGLLLVNALMCAAICWMLQAWMPSTWAFLGGLLAVLHIALFSYWINTYSGGGSVAALGGALVLGSLPRLMRGARLHHGMLLAVGIVLLATSRPYEGLLLCLPVAFVLARWVLVGKNRPPSAVLLRRAALPLLLLFAAAAWMGYYDYRVFGNPLTPPYKIDRATYAIVPYWVWQPLRPQPIYRFKLMQEFYLRETVSYNDLHNPSSYLPLNLVRTARVILFYAGITLLPALIMLRRLFLDRRVRFLVVCVSILAIGMLAEVFLLPYYLAPFTAAFYALGLQAMRHLRLWRPRDQPVGMGMVRLIVTLCFALAAIRLYANPLHLRLDDRNSIMWLCDWYGPGQFGAPRAAVETRLEHLPGKQLAIVRYSPDHDVLDEWVYNAADIDSSKVVWAREMDDADNLGLIRYYKNRTVWLVQPDIHPVEVSSYPAQGEQSSTIH